MNTRSVLRENLTFIAYITFMPLYQNNLLNDRENFKSDGTTWEMSLVQFSSNLSKA